VRGDRPFSEFTYAFAATHELTRLSPWWSRIAPIIPSLRAEGRIGYDVRFELPGSFLFIQFKLAQPRERLRLVGEERNHNAHVTRLRSIAYAGFWQFWTDARQHRLLSRLANRYQTAYYFAPRFNTQSDLHTHFSKRHIVRSSIIVRANAFPGPRTDQQHRHRVISPNAEPSEVFIFSEAASSVNLPWREEISRVGEKWGTALPIGLQLAELWNELPGNKRSRERILNSARRTLLELKSETGTIEPGRDMPRSSESRSFSDGGRRPVVPVRIPPWKGEIEPSPIDVDFGEHMDLLAKLSVIANQLVSSGIGLSVAQPAERAL